MDKTKFVFFLVGFLLSLTIALVFAQPQQDWIIEGNTVFINDSKAYISATPHTITKDGFVNFTLISKVYEGEIDVLWGFDINTTKPLKGEIFNPHIEEIEFFYICDGLFNFTTAPNHFWCFDTTINATHPELTLIFEHDFDWGIIPQAIAYWNETQEVAWRDIGGAFDIINHNFGGMNKWYLLERVSIQATTVISVFRSKSL